MTAGIARQSRTRELIFGPWFMTSGCCTICCGAIGAVAVETTPATRAMTSGMQELMIAVEKTKAKADDEAPLIWQGIAVEPLVRTAIRCEWWSRAVP